MADWMPPLPEQERLELITFSRNDLLQVVGYAPHAMHAYGQACARAALEQAAKVCQNERFMYSDEEWRIRCELADAMRELAREVTP